MHSPDPTAQINPEAVSRLHLKLNDPQNANLLGFLLFPEGKIYEMGKIKVGFSSAYHHLPYEIKNLHTIVHSYISH
jgi:hypothetical protein